jgi:hypothetical protein
MRRLGGICEVRGDFGHSGSTGMHVVLLVLSQAGTQAAVSRSS